MKRFEIIHAAHLHPPYGLWIVRHRGVVIGKQLSQPNQGDCELMLVKHRETPAGAAPKQFSYHLRGLAATRASQRRGGHRRPRLRKQQPA